MYCPSGTSGQAGMVFTLSSLFSPTRTPPSGQPREDELLEDELPPPSAGGHGPLILSGIITTTLAAPTALPSIFASIVVSPSLWLKCVPDVPRTSITISPVFESLDTSVIRTRLTPETAISNSSVRSLGSTVMVTLFLMSLMHGLFAPLEELLDELLPL